jgi:hypothetical protein
MVTKAKINFIIIMEDFAHGNRVWWPTPVIPSLRRLKQEDQVFETSLGYIARPCLKNNKLNK